MDFLRGLQGGLFGKLTARTKCGGMKYGVLPLMHYNNFDETMIVYVACIF
jgi:hypothetical protein